MQRSEYMRLRPGDVIKDKYKIKTELYAGGMGVVYLCEDTAGEKKYVIKQPLINGRNDEVKLEKLKVEATILKTLSHPYIVKYVDSFEEENKFFLVIEHIKGEDMKTIFYKKPAKEALVRNFCEQMLSALEYLHNQSIIHRDIKPTNIMVSGDHVTLIDFGGAKMGFTSLGQRPTYLWTPGYGAPEQHAGECYFQSDIYGLGATLYFLLTGEDPCKVPPLSPRGENPKVNKDLDAIIRKATDIDPNNRFQTVTEMREKIFGTYRKHAYPRLIIGSKEFRIAQSSVTIGRGGASIRPDIIMNDPERYLSKIHARVSKDPQERFWLEDCSVNGTFVFINGQYKKVKRWNLHDNDIVAFCWNAKKGPYMIMKFKLYQ